MFFTYDLPDIKSPLLRQWIIDPYIRWARTVVRVDTDVVMITHLLLYFITTIPSAIYLFYNFHWWHGLLHAVWQGLNMGTYTLMMHQHIHMRGILKKDFAWFDNLFPYITDPLMGHTWNSYYFHHVKHHHVEGNGPDDLSSTVRYQRDEFSSFLQYLGRFYFLIWFDLPRYFLRKRKPGLALKAGGSEICTYIFVYLMLKLNGRATTFVYLLPIMFMRIALMVGNWGQHAFVDETQPDSDFRSSITLIDAAVSPPTLMNLPIPLLTRPRATATVTTTATTPRITSTRSATGATTPPPSFSRRSNTPTSMPSSSTTSTTS